MANNGVEAAAEKNKTLSVLAALRDVVLIVAIVAYFAGFSYYSEVLSQFGLASNLVQFSLYDTLAYSFALFTNFTWLDAPLALVVLAVILLVTVPPDRLSPLRRILRNISLLVLVFGAFWLLHNLAYTKAQDFTLGERLVPDNYVKLVLKPKTRWKYGRYFVFLNERDHLTLLFQTSDTYYVLSQFAGSPDPMSKLRHASNEKVYLLPHGLIFAVPKLDVATVVTILPREDYAEKYR